MIKTFALKIMGSSGAKAEETEMLSRRNFLVGACAVVGTACLAQGLNIAEASAATVTAGPAIEPGEDAVELAQYIMKERPERRDNRMSRREIERECVQSKRFRRDNRGLCDSVMGREERRDNRQSRRDIERQCLQSNRFRRDNRGLCDRVIGQKFGRQGTCIQIGPIQVCE